MLLTVWPRQNYYTKAQPGPHRWWICLWSFFFPFQFSELNLGVDVRWICALISWCSNWVNKCFLITRVWQPGTIFFLKNQSSSSLWYWFLMFYKFLGLCKTFESRQCLNAVSSHVFEFFSNSKMLDIGFLTTVENWEKYAVFPKRYDHLFRVRRVKVCDHHNFKKKKKKAF
jgi:hypothetical protein